MDKNEAEQRLIGEAKALETSVAFLNSLPDLKGRVPSPPPSPSTSQAVTSAASNSPAPNPASPDVMTKVQLGRKIFFTGRLCSGKDFVANKIGANVYGFADPIYRLAEYLFNIKVTATEGKDKPGVRKLLQVIGQWGRNEVSLQYPLTVERAMFCMMIRSLAQQKAFQISGVDWASFGLSTDLWIDALLRRVTNDSEGDRVVVTNCRFPNEYTRLLNDGFSHFHCVCSSKTLSDRLRSRGLNPNSPEVTDFSEQLAFHLDKNLTEKLRQPGKKLQVVWSDENIPRPSDRLYTVEEFVKLSIL